MTDRLILLILVLLADVGSSLGVVYSRHEARQLAVQLSTLESQHDASVAEWSRLQLEQATLADAGQIEGMARDKLQMQQPDQVKILVVNP